MTFCACLLAICTPGGPHDSAFPSSLPSPPWGPRSPRPPSAGQTADPPSPPGCCPGPSPSARDACRVCRRAREGGGLKDEPKGLRGGAPVTRAPASGSASSRDVAVPQPPPLLPPGHTCYWGAGCVDASRVRRRALPNREPFWKGEGVS